MDPYSERLKLVDEALETNILKSQLAEWTEQREVLRATVMELWHGESGSGNGIEFSGWWVGVPDDVRAALVLTAFEDLPHQTALGPLINFVCPELLELQDLLENNGIKIAKMTQILVEQRENDEDVFSFSELESEFDSKPSTSARNSMKLARSCILLAFAAAILLVYESERNQPFNQ